MKTDFRPETSQAVNKAFDTFQEAIEKQIHHTMFNYALNVADVSYATELEALREISESIKTIQKEYVMDAKDIQPEEVEDER